jgi:hypothetical protein
MKTVPLHLEDREFALGAANSIAVESAAFCCLEVNPLCPIPQPGTSISFLKYV